MTWTKFGDDLIDTTWHLSDATFRLLVAGTTFSNRTLSNGFVPRDRLAGLMPKVRTALIGELIRAGFWREVEGGWVIVGFLRDQPSREEVEARRDYDAIRQRIRFRKDPTTKGELRPLEEAARNALNEARERRRAQAAQEGASQGDSPGLARRDSQRDSQPPVPPRPVPPPSKGEDGTETPEGRSNGRAAARLTPPPAPPGSTLEGLRIGGLSPELVAQFERRRKTPDD